MPGDRKSRLIQALKDAFAGIAGQDLKAVDPLASFFELGFDSLLLTQAAALLKNRFRVKITFRQLLEDLTTLDTLAGYMDAQMPAGNTVTDADAPPAPPSSPVQSAGEISAAPGTRPAKSEAMPANASKGGGSTALERIVKEQMVLMARQLELLRAAHPSTLPAPEGSESTSGLAARSTARPKAPAEARAFGPFRPPTAGDAGDLSATQRSALTSLVERYLARRRESKRLTQEYRTHLSDPRTVAGFRQAWKEMVFPIITKRSDGARFWDVDGNEYIDVTMGFGTNLLGHSPAFVTQAIAEQLKSGVEVGPQSPHTGPAAQLLCDLTGHERAAFCNTGSEAILAAIRIARTVTGRTRIATTGGYHGICDEVLVRGNSVGGRRVTVAVAPGIPDHVAREVLVVDYGAEESLEILRKNMDDLAIVLVEPVQSRHPDLQPREFLHELRRITAASETPLLFDEVITGFRCNLGGAQAHFGVKADLASWGKVIGGGMPIGALTGAAKYMDALDGGAWQYGDNSFPEAGVTFFAGTYVRHPLAMAAARAVLGYLKEQGPRLQDQLNAKSEAVATELRKFIQSRGVALQVEQFASIFYMHFPPEVKHGSLLWFYLRDKGIHVWENRPWFLSTAHTDEDIAQVVGAIKQSIVEMQEAGFLPPPHSQTASIPVLTAPVAIEEGPLRAAVSSPADKAMDFSIYFFGNYDAAYRSDKYKIILEAAKFADNNGFRAIWIPERHFHAVGGISPNPAVIAAALARETQHLQLRAGSVVLPLHHPVRVAEEWAVVDNLSNGRAGISIASGWHPNDFVFAPEAFDRRRELCWEGYEIIQKLWRGEEVEFDTGGKNRLGVKLHPMPKQSRLPTWLTCIHRESYGKAGELGLGVLGYTMNTTLEELAEKIRLYRETFAKYGHDPRQANVTILLHTFIAQDDGTAREIARQPMREYLRSYLDNSQKRLQSQNGGAAVEEEDIQYLLDRAFDDYVNGKALIGSPHSCAAVVAEMKRMGVDEIGCFLDFGVEPEVVLAHLPQIVELKRLCNETPAATRQRVMAMPQNQKGLAAVAAMRPDALRAYMEGNTLEMRGPLNLQALRHALQQCIDRHETLRTSLNPDGETLTIHDRATIELPMDDLSGIPADEQPLRKEEIFRGLEQTRFDLGAVPMMHARLIKLAEDRHVLVLLFHHVASNGPSYWVFLDDLCRFYGMDGESTDSAGAKPMQLSDFIQWRQGIAQSSATAEAEAYWMAEFADPPPPLELPVDHPRPPVITFRGGRGRLRLSKPLVGALRRMAATQQCSLYMALVAGFEALLHRLTGQMDVVVGTMFDSTVRSLPGGEGLFANTTNVLPLRSRTAAETTFAAMLRMTKKQVLERQEHQEYFFGDLVQKLKLKYDPSRRSLFSVLFNYERGTFRKRAAGVDFELLTTDAPYRGPRDTAMFELYLNIAEQDGELLCECDFNADLIDQSTLERWLGHFEQLLQAVAADPTIPLQHIPLLSRAEQSRMLVEWNNTARDYPRDLTVHALFQRQAREYPEKAAVRCGTRMLTYRQLDEASNELAARLHAAGVKQGDLVGLHVERSTDMVTGLFGILKSGAAYVPMDPDFPNERLQMMMEDAKMPAIVTQRALASRMGPTQTRTILIDEAPPAGGASFQLSPTNGGDLAYVIFTSGSTGRPKGVQVPHRAVVNFLNSMRREPGFTQGDVLLAVTTLSFDIAGLEMFLPLTTGGTVVIAPRDAVSDGHLLRAELERSAATVMQATPITWRLLLEAGWTGSARLKILCGGEALPPDLMNRLLPCCSEFWNMYGPTETTIWSTCQRITQAGQPISIGRPIDNTQIYIVNHAMQPQPPGVAGELLIGGDGVATGYLDKPDLTAERFIADGFSQRPGARLCRTGDVARWRVDGTVECLGRVDQQVKIRGFRIELGEVEAVLSRHPSVRECAVVAREEATGQKRLIAFVTPRDSGNGSGRLAEELSADAARQLPPYMVPSVAVLPGGLPRTPNGKVDRKALHEITIEARPGGSEFVAPRHEKEAALAGIWKQVLSLEKVSVMDSFFELGGDSLLGFRVANRANAIGLPVTIGLLFEHRTIAGVVKAMESGGGGQAADGTAPAVTRVSREAHRRQLSSIS